MGIAKATKNGSEISGDSSTYTKLHDGKYMIAISDGMGSGKQAKNSSSTVIKMLKRLLTTGFDENVSIELINSAINLNSNDETYATIDIAILDLKNGNIEFIKNGACPTFIKRNRRVDIIKSLALPAGILDNIDLVIYDKDLAGDETIVMMSDGIIESNNELVNKEIWIKDMLENIETTNVQEVANILVKEALNNYNGIANDDMTAIVVKTKKIDK